MPYRVFLNGFYLCGVWNNQLFWTADRDLALRCSRAGAQTLAGAVSGSIVE